jgi:hypothetical protein
LDDDPVSVQVGAEENNVVLVLGMASKAVEVKVVEGQGRVVQARFLAAGNDLGHLHHGLHPAMTPVLASGYLPPEPPSTG